MLASIRSQIRKYRPWTSLTFRSSSLDCRERLLSSHSKKNQESELQQTRIFRTKHAPFYQNSHFLASIHIRHCVLASCICSGLWSLSRRTVQRFRISYVLLSPLVSLACNCCVIL
ncbi:hypothetical protein M758_12G024300 [Ceratodon purpureus]|uniref:Uncharacterized protein n=1 Tax=Ceratodon purpureus TaxID=3225 RepID=A0A8T0G3V5_CERPU|nr:hypothetical protein KC19_12G024300 [Ceratodon purpureus]KAG0597837.1 hypothetical protein M758_12G024300 [Ceratodon purpureus]